MEKGDPTTTTRTITIPSISERGFSPALMRSEDSVSIADMRDFELSTKDEHVLDPSGLIFLFSSITYRIKEVKQPSLYLNENSRRLFHVKKFSAFCQDFVISCRDPEVIYERTQKFRLRIEARNFTHVRTGCLVRGCPNHANPTYGRSRLARKSANGETRVLLPECQTTGWTVLNIPSCG